jgi:hypothetical protein
MSEMQYSISEHRKLLFAILLSRRILLNFLHPKNPKIFLVSISYRDIAFTGQTEMHLSASLHFFQSIHAFPFFHEIAQLGHEAMHAPHAMHFFWFTCGFFSGTILILKISCLY